MPLNTLIPPRGQARGLGWCLTIKLVLDDVVEDLQEEEDQMVVLGSREEEPGGGEGLQQVQQLVGGHHGQALEVGGHCRGGAGSLLGAPKAIPAHPGPEQDKMLQLLNPPCPLPVNPLQSREDQACRGQGHTGHAICRAWETVWASALLLHCENSHTHACFLGHSSPHL